MRNSYTRSRLALRALAGVQHRVALGCCVGTARRATVAHRPGGRAMPDMCLGCGTCRRCSASEAHVGIHRAPLAPDRWRQRRLVSGVSAASLPLRNPDGSEMCCDPRLCPVGLGGCVLALGVCRTSWYQHEMHASGRCYRWQAQHTLWRDDSSAPLVYPCRRPELGIYCLLVGASLDQVRRVRALSMCLQPVAAHRAHIMANLRFGGALSVDLHHSCMHTCWSALAPLVICFGLGRRVAFPPVASIGSRRRWLAC